MPTTPRYIQPGWFTKNVANRAARLLARLGWAPKGLRQLAVPRRSSGGWQTVPVNLLELGSDRFLVAPRGETQWVRNIRVSGTAELRLGKAVEPIRVVELADEEKVPVLREYLLRWRAEVKAFTDLDHTSSDEDLLAAAPGFPAFRVEPA